MGDVDAFLAELHPRLVAELEAIHNGDPNPRLAIWSTQDPVTLFGAAKSGSGWDELSGTFRSIAARWSDCTDQPAASRAGGRSSTRHADQVLTEQRLPGEASSTYALRAITGVSACRGMADKPGAGRHRATSD